MGNKTRSILGEVVDFDLMRVKAKIEMGKKPNDVAVREKYIDIRRRRNPRRNVADLVTEQEENTNNAREKMQQSKLNREKTLSDKESTPTPTVEATVDVKEEITVDDIVGNSEVTLKQSKKIVKRSTTDDN
jgi:hypothetical protein